MSLNIPPLPPLPPGLLPSSPAAAAAAAVRPIATSVSLTGNILPPPPPPLPIETSSSVVDEEPGSGTPYITITGLKASIDSSIDQYVKDLGDRVSLKEVPVNGPAPGASKPPISNFTLVDGDFPKIQVDLYEQMVYHRSGSMNNKPLEILVPTRYKINHQKIIQYFAENPSDESKRSLVTSVIEEYGNNHNSLFYKHTITGKSNASGLDLDKTKREIIESKIDKWHNDYTGWVFYDNASTFFVQNRDIPRDELITLKMEVDDIFGNGDGDNSGLIKFVKDNASKYDELLALYNTQGKDAIDFFKETIVPYIAFFNIVFEDVKKHMNDQLNFVTNRKENMGSNSYEFNDTIKATLFKTYEELKMMLDNLGDITNVSLLNLLSVVNVFKQQIFEKNKTFTLKTLFDDYILNQKRITKSSDGFGSRGNPNNAYIISEINDFVNNKYAKVEKEGSYNVDLTEFINKHVIFNTKKPPGNGITSFEFQPDNIDIDIMFYLLYRATNNVVYEMLKTPKMFEKLDEIKTPELRKLQQEIDLKEKKLKNICDLIAKTSNFPVERILPDSAGYYNQEPGKNMGFVDSSNYKDEWTKKLTGTGPGINASNITLGIIRMKKKLEKTLGIYKESDLNIKTILNTLMSTLIENNTVQVLNMLFAKPRQIFYSPGMRSKFLSALSRWSFFQLGKPEIISKRAFKQFKNRLMQINDDDPDNAVVAKSQKKVDIPLELILKKKDVKVINLLDDLPFCLFIISSEPGPQLLKPGKDCANDGRFENKGFAAGALGSGAMVDDGSFTNALKNQFDKLNLPKRPNTENCKDARKQLGDAFDEMSTVAAGSLKEIGVDIEKKIKVDLPAKIAADKVAAAAAALDALKLKNKKLQEDASTKKSRISAIIKNISVNETLDILNKPLISPQEYRDIAIALCKYSSELIIVFRTEAENIFNKTKTNECKVENALSSVRIKELELLINGITDINCEKIADEATDFNDILDELRIKVATAVDNGGDCGTVLHDCYTSLLKVVKPIPMPAPIEIPPLLPPPPPSMEELDALNHPSLAPAKDTIDDKLKASKARLDTKFDGFLSEYHNVARRAQNKEFIQELCDYAQLSIQKYNQHATMVNDNVQKIPKSIVDENGIAKFITNISGIKNQIITDSLYCEVFKKDSAPHPIRYYFSWLNKILQKTKLSFDFGLKCSQSIKDAAESLSIIHRIYAKSSSSDDITDMKSHFDSIITLNNSNTIFKNDIDNIKTLEKQIYFETDKPLIGNIVNDIHLFNGKITQMMKLYEEMVAIYKKLNIPVITPPLNQSLALSALAVASNFAAPATQYPPPPHHPVYTGRSLPHELLTYYTLKIDSLRTKITESKNEFKKVVSFKSVTGKIIDNANKDNLKKAREILKTINDTITEMVNQYNILCSKVSTVSTVGAVDDDDIQNAKLHSAAIKIENIMKKGDPVSKETYFEFCKYAQLSIDNIYKKDARIIKEYNDQIKSTLKNYRPSQSQVLLSKNIVKLYNSVINTDLDCKSPDISNNISKTSTASQACSTLIFNGLEYISKICKNYYDSLDTSDKKMVDFIGKIEPVQTSGVIKYTGKLEDLNKTNNEIQKLIQDTIHKGKFFMSDEDKLKSWFSVLKDVNVKLDSMFKLYKGVQDDFDKFKIKFNSIDNRRISEENELAEIAAHGPPPLPPIPPPNPREKTHQDYINEATITTSKAHFEVVPELSLKENSLVISNKRTYHYMKQLCNYAKISIDHIYKVHASLIVDDFDAYDTKIIYFLITNHPDIVNDAKSETIKIIGTITMNYCKEFRDDAKMTDALTNILTKIRDTFRCGIRCSNIIKHGIDGLDKIVDKLGRIMPNAKKRIITLLLDGVNVLNESNKKFNRDIMAINVLVKDGLLFKNTPGEELKKLFTNLKQLNDNIASMVQNYNSLKKIFNEIQADIINDLPDVPPPPPPPTPPPPPIPPSLAEQNALQNVQPPASGGPPPPPTFPPPLPPIPPSLAKQAAAHNVPPIASSGQPPPPFPPSSIQPSSSSSGLPSPQAQSMPPQPPPIPISASPPLASVRAGIDAFLDQIKQSIVDIATLFQRFSTHPPTIQNVNIVVDYNPPYSAKIMEIANQEILSRANISLVFFERYITRKSSELEPLIQHYNNSKQTLRANIDLNHCPDAAIRAEILNNSLERRILDITADYNRDVDAASKAKKHVQDIQTEIQKIIGEGIDNLANQETCKTLFVSIQRFCNAYASYINRRIEEIENEVSTVSGEVTIYTTDTIQDLEERLLACIQGELEKLTRQFDADLAAITPKLQELTTEFETGTRLIGEIGRLLGELPVES